MVKKVLEVIVSQDGKRLRAYHVGRSSLMRMGFASASLRGSCGCLMEIRVLDISVEQSKRSEFSLI